MSRHSSARICPRWIRTSALAVGAVLLAAVAAQAFSGGPLNKRTWCGMMGTEQVCATPPCSSCADSFCHDTFNAPNTGMGAVDINNLPGQYTPGSSYNLQVFLQDINNAEFNDDADDDSGQGGFEVAALLAADLCQAGVLSTAATEPDTFVETDGASNTQWLKHDNPKDAVAGAVLWNFIWTAPPAGTGDVMMSVCGNATDGSGDPSGDRVYCEEFLIPEASGGGEICDNGTDDDGDGCVDGVDSDCGGTEGVCDNGTDDDCDGAVDCDDDDCASDPVCNPEVCDNGTDDDGDGCVDGADSDCGGTETGCDNGVDDDCDTFVDCDDLDCSGDPVCLTEDCGNGTDDDGDGCVDGADSDCGGTEGVCDDGIDDDCDGAVDCADDDCNGDPLCGETDCTDGQDNDNDGQIDCLDTDCADDPACIPEICDSGMDDDGDGRTDCQDTECVGDPACSGVENCVDGRNNDAPEDERVDCEDSDCADDPACQPEADCGDGVDNDGDGVADCEDIGCVVDCLPDRSGDACGCAGQDFDGDQVPNELDCSPLDSEVILAPPVDADVAPGDPLDPFPTLRVEKLFIPNFEPDTLLFWSNMATTIPSQGFPGFGRNTVYDVIAGFTPDIIQQGATAGMDAAYENLTPGNNCVVPDFDPRDVFNGPGEGACDDGVDGGEDGLVDCADPECADDPACDGVERGDHCANFIDDDGDTMVDCNDPECFNPGAGVFNYFCQSVLLPITANNLPDGVPLYFLLRPENTCAKGTWGDASFTPDARNFLDTSFDCE